MSDVSPPAMQFRDLDLSEPVFKALESAGYESPTTIQSATIPHLLAGKDLVGQAQTGTGKTAAFALPILSRIQPRQKKPQALVLAPTRELALQVAEAFQRYAHYMNEFHVLPIYGGQDYGGQIRQLKRGVDVVVGTPGRVMDHMRRGTLDLSELKTLVLDEADEMLRMGFIDDVEWILEQTPPERQIALFSATMPTVIRRIAQKHLNNPEEISIKLRTSTAETIRQRYWLVSGLHKLDALTRILEGETLDGLIIFVLTTTETVALAERLQARGYSTSALNGDMPQAQRERTVDQLRKGKLDILVATDVVARGLDVERISHVINYDIPYDTESYVHRIGRTGRAGRSGEAILFVAPRERNMLRNIERATRQQIELMDLPSTETVNDKRVANFFQRITDTLAKEEWKDYVALLEQYQHAHNIPALEIAAAMATLAQGSTPLLIKHEPVRAASKQKSRAERPVKGERPQREKRKKKGDIDVEMETFRIEVGSKHNVKPGNIVGAIANEAGLEGEYIGNIKIFDEHSVVDLPVGMPREVFEQLKRVWVVSRPLNISRVNAGRDKRPSKGHKGKGRRASEKKQSS